MSKILIIEDSLKNQMAAKVQLPNAIVVNYDEAFRLFLDAEPGTYDVVLTDLMFLIEKHRVIDPSPFNGCYPQNMAMLGTEQPLGFAFVMKATELGIPATIVTDGDHHSNLFVGLMDMFCKHVQYDENGPMVTQRYGNDGSWHEIILPAPTPPKFSRGVLAKDMFWDNGVIVQRVPEGDCERVNRVKDWRAALTLVQKVYGK